MENAGIEIPGESGSHDASPDRVAQAQETKAREKNWRPLEEWKGAPEDWVDAREFLGRQSLFDKIAAQKSQIDNLRQTQSKELADIKAAFAQMSKVQYDKAMRDLKAERKVARDEQDFDKVDELDEQIQEVQKQKVATEIQTKPVDNAIVQQQFAEWRAKESWYDKDPELKREADAVGIGYGVKNPSASAEDVFEYVTKTVKKLFPEKFETKGKPMTRENAAAVEAGGLTQSEGLSKTKTDKISVADLTPDQQRIMNTLVKSGVVTKEQYLAQMQDAMSGQHKTFKEYQPKKEGK